MLQLMGSQSQILLRNSTTTTNENTLNKINKDFSSVSDGKDSVCNEGDRGSIPGSEDPLEKEMATHSSILTWRISWTEEPGGLQAMRP